MKKVQLIEGRRSMREQVQVPNGMRKLQDVNRLREGVALPTEGHTISQPSAFQSNLGKLKEALTNKVKKGATSVQESTPGRVVTLTSYALSTFPRRRWDQGGSENKKNTDEPEA